MITKKAAMERVTEADRDDFATLEKKIDMALLTFDGETAVSVCVDGVTRRVLVRLERGYADAGWTVKRRHVEADQRDPRERSSDWLDFS